MTSLFCKPWVLTAVLLAVCVQARAETAAVLPAAVQEALKAARLPPDALSVVVLPVQTGNPRLQHQAGVQRNPASLMKLVTTSAALDLLGPAFTWRTPVYLDGQVRDGVLQGNLYLQGSGDPRFGVEQLWLLLRRVQGLGIRSIQGRYPARSQRVQRPGARPGRF